ncbi:hypothetical protein GZH53_18090 [Flavihumibacter sp. R14]|nr:hypothetical protein [Flavihumibacter soli]
MFIFPLIYISAFFFSLKEIIRGNRQAILLFLIFGLPIYITTLSIAFDMGLRDFIGILQLFKEALILTLLGFQVFTLKTRLRFHFIDYAVIAYFCYTLLYALLPIGEQGFVDRIIAFKSISFFPLIYFCGRLIDLKQLYLNKYFHFILYLSLAAAAVVMVEYLTYQHFQTITGYADYHFYFYNFDPTGSYGLTHTFEAEGGMKRFASFFANPLEHAAATILAVAVIAALYTGDDLKIKLDTFGKVVLVATQISIFLALSRSAFLSYFLMIYAYAWMTGKRQILNLIHGAIVCAVLYFIFLLRNDDMQEFVISTLNFTNPSSVGHVLDWIEGIMSMVKSPLGLGLGTSGRVGGSLGDKTGGENQFIIIGVQAGVIAMGIYLAIYIGLVKTAFKWFYRLKGKEKKLCLALLLMKIGFIIPFLTSELESSSYISYVTWLFSGLFVAVISSRLNAATIHPDNSSAPEYGSKDLGHKGEG